jgi:hypothetical protein
VERAGLSVFDLSFKQQYLDIKNIATRDPGPDVEARDCKAPSGRLTRCCPPASDCRAFGACPLAKGNLRESLGVALASVDESKEHQCQRPLTSSLPFSCFETDWQTLSNAAVMTTMVSGR